MIWKKIIRKFCPFIVIYLFQNPKLIIINNSYESKKDSETN